MRIQRKPLSEEVYKRLLGSIMTGKYPAGSRLCEEKLGKSLGVSRTPLREAMIRLAREGALEKRHNYGCVVRKLSIDDVEELMEGRRLLECLALREWFPRIDIDRLKALSRRMGDAATSSEDKLRGEILSLDEEMHELIVAACANRFLAGQIRHLQLRCRPYRVYRCSASADTGAILAERQRVIDAILAGDVDGAVAGLAAHFDCSLTHYRQSLIIQRDQ